MMRSKIFVFAALMLAACGQAPAAPQQQPQQTQQQSSVPTTTLPPVPDGATGQPVTAQMLPGRWGDNGDCAQWIEYRPDGGFAMFDGREGRWTLSGDQMTMGGAGGAFTVRVQYVDEATITVINPDGSYGFSRRC